MAFDISYNFEAVDDFSPTLNRISRGFSKLSNNISKMSDKMRNAGERMSKFGRNLSLKAGAPLAAFGVFAVKSAVDFQRAINMVGADTNATAQQLAMLRAEALKYGASTQFSATQVAQAEFFLGRAGTHVNDIMSMLPGVLQLAASAQLDMGSASKIAIEVMKGYGFQAKDLAHVNNILVKTFTTSNTDLTTLAESFKLAGPIMKSAGVSFQDAASLIAVLGNSGIQATMAGTGMRKVVASLLHPNAMLKKSMKELNMTFIDAKTGKLDLIRTMKELHDNGLTTAGALTAFGVRGGNAMAALMEHYFGILKQNKALKHTGDIAQKIAAAQMMGLPGATRRLTSAFQNLRIELVDAVTPQLEKLLGWLTKLLSGFNNSSTGIRKWIGYSIGAVVALGPLLMGIGKFVVLLALVGKLGWVTAIIRGLGVAFSFMWDGLLGPIGLVIGLGTLIFVLYKKFKLVRDIVKVIGKVLYITFYPLIAIFKMIIKLMEAVARWANKPLVGGVIGRMFHKTAPALGATAETPHSVFGGMSAIPAGASYGRSQHVKSTLNINVADKNNIISGITGQSTADDFGMSLGTNMAMSRY